MNSAAKHNRQIAKISVRNVWNNGTVNDSNLDSRLLDEARSTDYWLCTGNEMLALLKAEWRKLHGQTKGGHISAIRRKAKAQP